jgi:toxin ParE1/3/4
MRKVIRRPEARRDIIAAATYIAEHAGFNASERFLKATDNAFDTLSLMPRMGVLRDYGNPDFAGMRMWPVPRFNKYLIFYLVTEEELEIVRVLHGARNIQEIFAPTEE